MTALGDKAVQLAQGLIRCESVTPADAGVLDVLIETLKPARFTFWRLTFKDEGTPPVDNLYARVGDGPPHLCLRRPCRRRAAGRCRAVEPSALRRGHCRRQALRPRRRRHEGRRSPPPPPPRCDYVKRRARTDGSISLLITGDEEGPAINGTRKLLAWMKEQGERPDHCLVGEPTNARRIGEAIKIGRRGSADRAGSRSTGVQGHVAYPHLASNPVKGLVKILAASIDAPLDYGSAHFSPSNLEVTSIDVGNPTVNVIPASRRARASTSATTTASADALKALLREQATLGAVRQDRSPRASSSSRRAESFLTEPGPLDRPCCSEAVRELPVSRPALSTDGGTSDARFIKDHCPVVEFGLTTATIHKVDENASVADLELLTAVYRRFISLYFETFGGADAG